MAIAARHDNGNRPALKFRLTICESSGRAAKVEQNRRKLFLQSSSVLVLLMPTLIVHRPASQTERKPGAALSQNLLIPPPTSRGAFCVWPIWPATRSTGLADMRQSFGARPARFCLLSMHSIAANHKGEAAVSVSTAGKTRRPTDTTTIEPTYPRIYMIDAELGRDGQPIGINRG